MLRTSCIIAALALTSAASPAQAPSPSTLALSLKTVSKALAGCRTSYTRVYPGAKVPLLKSVIGDDPYGKDLTSLDHAERFTNLLIAHPEKVSGKALVAILSTSDDFSVGVGSTRAEVLSHIVLDRADSQRVEELMVASEALNACQKSLFDAGDDFVELVMNYVGAEDEALAVRDRQQAK